MTINNLNELKKLIQLCRKQGVEIVKIDGIELVLKEQPIQAARKRANKALEAFKDDISTPDDLSPEELLFYSSGTFENLEAQRLASKG